VREFNRLEPKRRNDEFSPSYHARLAVAGALVEIFRSFAVLLPVSKYRHQIDKLKIEGEYAVLQEKHKRGQVAFLHLRADDFSSDEGARPPNIISYLSHWHVDHAHWLPHTPAIVS
jgi:hypothetical protein